MWILNWWNECVWPVNFLVLAHLSQYLCCSMCLAVNETCCTFWLKTLFLCLNFCSCQVPCNRIFAWCVSKDAHIFVIFLSPPYSETITSTHGRRRFRMCKVWWYHILRSASQAHTFEMKRGSSERLLDFKPFMEAKA